ncbi:MAG TPA: trehalose-6-phosphate synthase [Acidimicrobiales bacterium]|nr:trehalose-6-phosphate synthase [Acidimicrobiales bacterium]
MGSDIVVVSNRGPVAFARDDAGKLIPTKAGGGLVNALGPAVEGLGATWIAAAMSDADREVAEGGRIDAGGYHVRLLTLTPHAYRAYYDVVSNSTLWYLYHGLFDAVRRPVFDRRWRHAWAEYRAVNAAFAAAVAEDAPEGATVLVHDYHLALLAPHLRDQRDDLRTVHFHHTPFCGPDEIRMLPHDVAGELLGALAAHGACGFHARRWADAFAASCKEVLGEAPPTFVSAATANLDELRAAAAAPSTERARRALLDRVGDRAVIARNDRMELSKNVLRGFLAFEELLDTRPEWHDRVCFVAYVYPSRQTLADYLAYRAECEALAERINARFSTPAWTPILLSTDDDFAGAVAAMRIADVVLVNPVRDGLNLVAKEAVSVNERDCVLLLSTECGAWDELGEWAVAVHPFDVSGTAGAMHAALTMGSEERRSRAGALRAAAAARGAVDWFRDLIAET